MKEFRPDYPCSTGTVLRPIYKVVKRSFANMRSREYKYKIWGGGYKDFMIYDNVNLEDITHTYYDCVCPCTGGLYYKIVEEDHISTESTNDYVTISKGGSLYGNEYIYDTSELQMKIWTTEDYYGWGCGSPPGLKSKPLWFF